MASSIILREHGDPDTQINTELPSDASPAPPVSAAGRGPTVIQRSPTEEDEALYKSSQYGGERDMD